MAAVRGQTTMVRGEMDLMVVRNRRVLAARGATADKEGSTAEQGMTHGRRWAEW